MRQPFRLETGDQEVSVSVSIGVVSHPSPRSGPDEVLRGAAKALLQAKRAGGNQVCQFDSNLPPPSTERIDLANDLFHALERDELRVHFQPEVDLKTGQLIGLESLVRWQHPAHGLLLPGDFLSIAEETGLIVPISEWVLRESCVQARQWQNVYKRAPLLFVSVNVTARWFQHKSFLQQVAAALDETGLKPECLEIEITESGLMDDPDATVDTLEFLKALGVRVAIDDFGTGYSSLSYLRRFPVQSLKIDRSLIAGLEREDDLFAVLQSIASLAHALGISVTAEGTETDGQVQMARDAGCDRAQGYYFSKPLPREAVSSLLTRLATSSAAVRPAPRMTPPAGPGNGTSRSFPMQTPAGGPQTARP
jgi:EAL domain-containing protein (putative c-di-GMP-specific phosphodiesterase class I)